jgi:tryptophan-rich sensory protein
MRTHSAISLNCPGPWTFAAARAGVFGRMCNKPQKGCRMIAFLILVGFGGACAAAGLTGMLFKPGLWYAGLAKPRWTPPNILFPIIWTTLYVLMAWAAWRVASAPPGTEALLASAGLGFWTLQITLNALWSPIFFGLRRPKIALVVIAAMELALLGAIWGFAAVDLVAAAMMVPTLIWGGWAAALNYSVWRMNPPDAFGLPQGAAR